MATATQPSLAPRNVWPVLAGTGRRFLEHDCFTYAAALAFYFLMALFPFVIFLASSLAYLPVPRVFERVLRIMGQIAPSEGIGVIQFVLQSTLKTNKTLLSAGFLGALWAAAAGFHSTASAMNKAYEVKETRSLIKRRLLALAFTCLLGLITTVAMTMIAMGPHFVIWLSGKLGAGLALGHFWRPILRWTIFVTFMSLMVEVLYLVGPNIRVRFRDQLPGALVAIATWLLASGGVSWYLRNLANSSKMYGGLGAVIALMLWFYVSAVAILLGAEMNAELTRLAARLGRNAVRSNKIAA